MNITYIHSQHPVDQYRVQLRCKNLASAFNRNGWHKAQLIDFHSFIHHKQKSVEACKAADILVIHRYLFGPVLQAMQYWKARDKKVILDFDEAINFLAPGMFGYPLWIEGRAKPDWYNGPEAPGDPIQPMPIEQFKWGLRLVDAATVPSSRLAHDWSKYGRILHLPDYLNLDRYLTLKKKHEGQVWIGLGGDQTNPVTLHNSGLLQALERVCQQRPQVRVLMTGTTCEVMEEIKLAPEQKIACSNVAVEEWPQVLANLNIGLAPVASDYDLRQSWQRVLEYMAMKIPWISSDLLPYRELARYGFVVPNSASTWEHAILQMVDHVDTFQMEAAGEPFLFALSQDVNENLPRVLDTYESGLN